MRSRVFPKIMPQFLRPNPITPGEPFAPGNEISVASLGSNSGRFDAGIYNFSLRR